VSGIHCTLDYLRDPSFSTDILNVFRCHSTLETCCVSALQKLVVYYCIVLSADKVREYYGETIAMYFAFLGYYTFFLAPPAVLGVITNFYVSDSNRELSIIIFCIFNLVWATIFLESWKRRTSELAYEWGTINTEHFEAWMLNLFFKFFYTLENVYFIITCLFSVIKNLQYLIIVAWWMAV